MMKYASVLVITLLMSCSNAFAPSPMKHTGAMSTTTTQVNMGLFDGFSKAFSNEEVSYFVRRLCVPVSNLCGTKKKKNECAVSVPAMTTQTAQPTN
jgi:hypothetical protein